MVAGLAGCATHPAADAGELPLAGSLEVQLSRDTAYVTLHVTNATDAAVLLEYPSTQRYDFEVRTAAGETLWTWSAARSFAQVLTEERLEAGASLRYSAAWAPAQPGSYVAVGRLTSTSHPLVLTLPFEVARTE